MLLLFVVWLKAKREKYMIIKDIENIFKKIGPHKFRLLKTEDILKWRDDNSHKEHIKNIDLSDILDTRGVVVAAFEYNINSPELPEGCMSISPYYYFSNIYYMKLKEEIRNLGYGDEIKFFNHIPLKILANISGIGYFGKNTIIHNDEFGSAMFLYALGIKEECMWDTISRVESDCGDCRLCIDACPMGALDKDYVLNREKCIRNYMLEGIEVPQGVGKKMGKRLLGCDICQNACPKNIRTSKIEKMPDYDKEIFLIDNYIKNKDKGLKQYINPLSKLIGRNYARTKRVLYQCEIISKNK